MALAEPAPEGERLPVPLLQAVMLPLPHRLTVPEPEPVRVLVAQGDPEAVDTTLKVKVPEALPLAERCTVMLLWPELLPVVEGEAQALKLRVSVAEALPLPQEVAEVAGAALPEGEPEEVPLLVAPEKLAPAELLKVTELLGLLVKLPD